MLPKPRGVSGGVCLRPSNLGGSTDNSLEFCKACGELVWNHDASTPRRSETKSKAESAVRRVEEGTAATLVHCGLSDKWWSDAM